MLLSNPVFIGVVLMTLLCFFRFNVLLSVLLSGILVGVWSQFMNVEHLDIMSFFANLPQAMMKSMQILIDGMQGNLQTALSYILLGAVAAAISKTNLTAYLIKIVSQCISQKKYLLILSLALIACFSQNLIPIHVAFVPLLIPPLLKIFNRLKIDRRAIACALTFGLTTPYMVLPLGFGLIFQTLLVENLNSNGVQINLNDVSQTMIFAVICMLVGLFLAVFIFYAKPREYKEEQIAKMDFENLNMGRKEWGVLIGLALTLILQILTHNLPLSGLLGFVLMVILGGVEYKKVNLVFDDGLKIMGYIAFVMLVASGYGEVLKQSGGIADLVKVSVPFMEKSHLMAIAIMLLIGLLITMGIGSSFGTIPIIAALFCPICLELGFSPAAIIFIIGVAGALGDAGSPASETTLGISVGLNADGQSDHIRDTCIPTFIFFNGSLLILGSIIAFLLL
ncbi:sodium:proton antiporter [Campylobacter insulaenigrae]|uniref:Sodium:proton antiporter n=1 Tax=Campylobacter insulaenigrae TaxID=260714 RepID=A0ABY3G5S7_9BACT|nr:Na+/H+ antiporter NhaC family protein [Campylobacter insulaenigrae]MCR6571140.1 sodium:proton antiporter [Campylobacter insulaenigrae]MCR6572845.1 sodium:proton antiporter [Campylobacter insulaenigrae]MCR6574133.1 sodium:proton antiporter [Campylobacter insulaenigrae]MCR6575724.1 sodium:proton antiporter [Campylobacter insulaenigrae]MCR6577261.1 sodium:proton antiporter [Campylobacter insulaenigrae]